MRNIKTIVFLICFQLIVFNGFTQNHSINEQNQIDSLKEVVTNTNNHDSILSSAYLQLATLFYVSDIDTALSFCKKAEQLLTETSSNVIKGEVYGLFGYLYLQQEKSDLALKYNKKSKEIFIQIGDKQNISNVLINIGLIYHNQGDILNALNAYHESIRILEEINNEESLIYVLINMAYLYENQEDYTSSLKYNKKGLALCKKLNNKKGEATCLNNIGIIYDKLKDHSTALDYYNKSLEIEKEIDNPKGVAYSLICISNSYIQTNEYTKALNYCLEASEICKKIGDKKGFTAALNNLGIIYLKQGKIFKAEKIATESFSISKELGFPKHIKRSAELLSQIYEKQNKGMQSLAMYKLYVQMRDSINNNLTQKATIQQQAKYEYEKQAAADSIANAKVNEIRNAQIAQQKAELNAKRNQQYALYGGLFLVILFAVLMYNRFKVTQKQKVIIEEKERETHAQKEVIEEKHKEITDSIQYAKRIQNAILPPQKLVKEYLPESFILYQPKDVVAGDFYWMEYKNNNILFAAADCTGHGVPGAMVSVVCNNGLNRSVREHGITDPGELLNKTREIVIAEFEKSEEDVKDGMDIALCSLRLDVEGLKLNKPETIAILQYAGANNPLWIVRKAPPFLPEGEGKPHTSPPQNIGLAEESSSPSGRTKSSRLWGEHLRKSGAELIEIKPNKQPVGKHFRNELFVTHTIELQKGDTIYVFTDGFADQFGGEKGKKFMYKPFKNLLLSIQDKTMNEQKEILEQHFENWKGNLEQVDDVCVIGVRI